MSQNKGPFSFELPYGDVELPVTPCENYNMLLRGETPFWMPTASDEITIRPRIVPDNSAFGLVADAPTDAPDGKGGRDMFGVEWTFVEMAGGAMPAPGDPLLDDANEWRDKVKFPDVKAWDWKASGDALRPYIPQNKFKIVDICCGLFERLISFMDFAGAAVAVIDDEQKDAVHALFSRLCDMYDDMIDGFAKHYGADCIIFHDDWGSQRAPFFSIDTCREMLVPYLRRVAESAHKRGMWFYFHSCGKNELLVPAMTEADVNLWKPQPMNDHKMLVSTYPQIVFPGNFGVTPENVTQQQADADAERILAELEGRKNVVFSATRDLAQSPAYPKYCNALYRLTRKAYGRA